MSPSATASWRIRAALLVCAGWAAGCGGDSNDLPRPTGPVSVGRIDLPSGAVAGGAQQALTKDDGPRFSGIAWTMIRGMSCSGAFVVPSAELPAGDAPAYLLTAGHCVRNPLYAANEVERGVDVVDTHSTVLFRHFGDSPDAATMVGVRAVAFGTMKGQDLGIVELEPTRGQLRSLGVVPFVLSARPSEIGEPIAVVGHPGLGNASLAACQVTHRASMILEGPYHWFDYEANDCQGIIGGSSGSPVFSLATGEVLAVINTVAAPLAGFLPCMEDHPCEVGDGAIHYAEASGYGGGLSTLARCFDDAGRFDPVLPACPLDRGLGMQPSPGVVAVTVGAPPAAIELMPAGLTHYRLAYGPAGTVDCRDPAAYGPITEWVAAPSLSIAASSVPGVNLLCVQAGVGADPATGWQAAGMPTVVTVRTWGAD